ncbi:MAG: hypothetical protein WAW54_10850 [Parvibaculum sedimenti]|uniref:hypothetical protein n=1 Tax=Parvibaculum sedimenti TaxID=2608632 RepID=UPI003BB6B37D
MNEVKHVEVAIKVPVIDSLSDDELSEIAHMRDGRWSAQTKALLEQFETTKLDLNSGWASTWTGWCCPCCQREKPRIARVSSSGILLCRLEYHHDHILDLAKRIYREHNPRNEDREINIQVSRAKDALMPFIERFERTLICIDCNLAEGRAKLELGTEMEGDFTFTPSEIATFITVAPNRVHEVDVEKARLAWLAAKDDFADRIDFTRRMAQRIASGRHRREVAPGQRVHRQTHDRDVIYRLFARAMPSSYSHQLGMRIEMRSISNDGAGRSQRPKRQPKVQPPTDAEFAGVDATQRETKAWALADSDWLCPCCARPKREICRKSKRGLWTARIHRVVEYLPEDDEESLVRRRIDAAGQTIIGSYRQVLICHDCRNIVAELQRRQAGFGENSLTLNDLRELVGSAIPHSQHGIDFRRAIDMAIANAPLIEAIEDYWNHRSRAIEAFADVKRTTEIMSWSWSKARDCIGYELAKTNGWELDDGDAHANWLLKEAQRIFDFEETIS